MCNRRARNTAAHDKDVGFSSVVKFVVDFGESYLLFETAKSDIVDDAQIFFADGSPAALDDIVPVIEFPAKNHTVVFNRNVD